MTASSNIASNNTSLVNTVRSELIRIWRPSFLYAGIGIMAVFAVLISVFIYMSLADPGAAIGPGLGATTAADIEQPGVCSTPSDL